MQSSASYARQHTLQGRAHFMRYNPSPPEARFWQAVRAKKLGVSVKRQVVIQRYIVDFLFPSKRLVVEIDGAQHCQTAHADARRDKALARLGYRTLRVPAQLVHCDLPGVLRLVRTAFE